MKQILESFERIAAVSGNAKVALVATESTGDVLWAMKRALDPMITHGVGKKTLKAITKKVKEHGVEDMPVQEAENVLSRLQSRLLTGKEAINVLSSVFAEYSPESWEVLSRIITKDIRAGMTAKTLNEALGRTEIEVFEVALAHPYKAKHIKRWPVKSEIKFDGVRTVCFADLAAGSAIFLSRTGKEFYAFRTLAADVIEFLRSALNTRSGRVVLDGEVITGDFLKTVAEVRRKSFDAKDAVFQVFEFLSEAEFVKGCSLPEERRRSRLEALFKRAEQAVGKERVDGLSISLVEQELLNSDEEVRAAFLRRFQEGFEGIIVKQPDFLYERKRGYGYLKIKDIVETAGEVDLKIKDVYEGEGKYEGMAGGVIVDFNGVDVRIGGGFSDRQRAEIWADHTGKVVTYTSVVWEEELDEMVTVTHKVKPSGNSVIGRLIEVKYHEITAYGSMRHGRFHRFRDLLTKGEIV